jgi:hypothetical protein
MHTKRKKREMFSLYYRQLPSGAHFGRVITREELMKDSTERRSRRRELGSSSCLRSVVNKKACANNDSAQKTEDED